MRAVERTVSGNSTATHSRVHISLRPSIQPMDSDSGISSRAQPFLKPAMPYLNRALEAIFDEYSDENPNGQFPLVIAENKLCADILMAKLKSFSAYTSDVLNYTDTTGLPSTKLVIANFLGQYVFGGTSVSPGHLVLSTGCTALLCELSLLLFEKNDSVLIPAPYYPAFDPDFFGIGGVSTIPVWPRGEPSSSMSPTDANKWVLNSLTEDSLDDAYRRSIEFNHSPKALLIVNPGNPTGAIYSDEQLLIAVNWTIKHGMHLIVDEIYALSVYNSPTHFKSIVTLLEGNLGNYVHVLWGLSKDFGASGLRVGVLYSKNEQLLKAFTSINMAFQVSNLVQQMTAHILSDMPFIDQYLAINKKKLKHSYDLVVSHLQPLGINFVSPAGASIFCFADFRALLRENTFEQERALFKLLADSGVVLTPGESCHCQIPGFFRICFAWVPEATLLVAMRRIEKIAASLSISPLIQD